MLTSWKRRDEGFRPLWCQSGGRTGSEWLEASRRVTSGRVAPFQPCATAGEAAAKCMVHSSLHRPSTGACRYLRLVQAAVTQARMQTGASQVRCSAPGELQQVDLLQLLMLTCPSAGYACGALSRRLAGQSLRGRPSLL